MSIEQLRRTFAERLCAGAGVRSERLIAALAETPRERFLGPGPWAIAGYPGGVTQTPDGDPAHLYQDVSVALDAGRNLYNGAPGMIIPWIDALDLREEDRVFHVGGGAGYYTAILANVVGPNGHIVMAEVDERLGRRARELLADPGNVDVVAGDGALCDPGACDAILVNAGVTHPAPLWLDRLKDGGRMALPLTFELPNSGLGKGAAVKITRRQRAFSAAFLPRPLVIYSCSSVRDAAINEALLNAYSTRIGGIGEVRSLRLAAHEQDPTCWMHADTMCLSSRA